MASGQDDLEDFVRQALMAGRSRSGIEQVLLGAGWPDDAVARALGAYAEADFPIPVPRPKTYVSAGESFTYLALFIMLYLSAWSVGRVLFLLIEMSLPDAADAYGILSHSFHWPVAQLIVAFPIFLFLSARIARSWRADPLRRASKARKWITYLSLFIAGLIVVGDVTALVYNFLTGDLSLRVVLKLAVVGGLAGAGFWYYLSAMRADEARPVTN